MGISGSLLLPQELIPFKNLPADISLDNIEIPEPPEDRRPTNVKWLIVFAVFVAILLPFMIYTLCYSDMARLIKGYDKCGNICGRVNYHYPGIECSGKDYTSYPYLQFEDDYTELADLSLSDRQCVQACKSEYVKVLDVCVKVKDVYPYYSDQSDVTKVKYDAEVINLSLYLKSVKWQIIISCLLSIGVSIGMLFLFRHAIAFVVWGILIGCFVTLCVLFVIFLHKYQTFAVTSYYTRENENRKIALLTVVIVFAIFALVLGIVLIWCRNKIKLVIMLLKEATKAVFDMPGLLIIPVICVAVIFILTILFAVTTFAMSTAGNLELYGMGFYDYVASPVMVFTVVYNFVVYLWFTQFFTGIQYMVVAGAVSKWYFSRDKNYFGSPIKTSASVAFRYHLGTVALGSMIITIVQVIRAIILSLINNDKLRAFVQSCIDPIENFFKFLSKNAYIITAIHGQPFIRSGKRAAKLIAQNIKDVIAINTIGDFVLGMAKFVIVVITVLLSMAILAIAPGEVMTDGNLPAYIIIAIVSTIVACVTFAVFETTIDTLFICYCEDNLLNDGMARPYFMSRNLMEFVQSSKQVYAKK